MAGVGDTEVWVVRAEVGAEVGGEAVTLLKALAWRLEEGVSITLTLGMNLEVNLFFL